MWSNIKSFCNLIEIDDTQLFSKQRPIVTNENSLSKKTTDEINLNQVNSKLVQEKQPKTPPKSPKTNNTENLNLIPTELSNTNGNPSLPPTPQPSCTTSASSSSSSSTTNSSDSTSTATDSNEPILKAIGQKRRSTAASSSLSNTNRNRLNSDNLDDQSNQNDYENQHSTPKIYKLDVSLASTPSNY